ncbi:hypothetical protein Cgig2_031277 [Carnegiea gigantea]|uniref:NAC domain-containing protein n=1 Tax=Carnegiea gigantea TaxID=171969 RepID=A0A9Q1KMD5_9CARY|nr:hypothetical protein Cgig2_031277 [Carnegiea gigantea]
MDEKNDGDHKVDDVILPGFRFHPTDEELVGFYLKRKVQRQPLSIELIKQLDIYKYDPWDLPKFASTGEKEWYFYCPRDRKYRNSARPNRVTGAGFWKATGTDRPIYSSEGNRCIGLKKSLVFYKGRAAKGVKTDWMMHEFRLPFLGDCLSSEKTFPTNDLWAICRIFKKTSPITPRTLSHSWVSPSLPNPSPNPNINPSNNYALSSCIRNNHHLSSENIPSPLMQPNSKNTNKIDSIARSSYPFSLLDIPTLKPICPTNSNNKPTLFVNSDHPFPNINPNIFDLPPSYMLPQLEDPSDNQAFKSNIDASSMLLNMQSSMLMGHLDNPCDGNMEFAPSMFSQDHDLNGDKYQDFQSALMGDLSNLVDFEDGSPQCGGISTLGSFSAEGLLPLDVLEAWKLSTPLVWDCAPLS